MNINLVAPISQLGYGVAGFNVLKALVRNGNHVALWPISEKISWENKPADLELIQNAIRAIQLFDTSAPSIRLWHQHDLALFPGKGTKVGWPIFELDNFTSIELNHLNAPDRLFVCSEWALGVIRAHLGNIPVDVVPLGVDREVFFIDEEARAQRPYWSREDTAFLNIGKWEVRKGHNELLEAFNKAFEPTDKVQLWMMNDNPFIELENEQWKMRYLSSKMGGRIKFFPRVESQGKLRALMNQADVGVFISRAEGFNLEPLELAACGIPSIVTNYSGHTEYLNENNALLVEPDGMEKAHDNKWFHGQGMWCTFPLDDVVEKMRQAHQMRQSGGLNKFTKALGETASNFSWTNTARTIVRVLNVS